MALRLESVLGVPASFWNNLEAIYREKLERVRKEKELEEEAKMVEHFPYSKMVTLGWIAPTTDKKERVYNLRRFFEVATLNLLENLNVPGIAYRRTGRNEKSDYNLAVWAQKARLEARKIKTEPINIAKLEQSVERIRAMTMEDPEVFSKELVDLLAGCGVALVFLSQIDGSFLHGASFYDGNHIVMGLTLRGSYADIFWFSFFHELCHIIRGHINNSAMATEEQGRSKYLRSRYSHTTGKVQKIRRRKVFHKKMHYYICTRNWNSSRNSPRTIAKRRLRTI